MAIKTFLINGLQLVHPIGMILSLGVVFYTLYLGIKARQIRSAKGEDKKQLIAKKYGIRHYQLSSILLVILTAGPILGMAVTYMVRGKLYLDQHSIVGLTIAVLIGMSASFAPFMQQGNIEARNIHFAIGVAILGLFGWQLLTGMQILRHYVAEML